ncbi:hypothetical protein GJ744_001053 [Endocarpon pusillum]|uniref:Uncharacterized protein n=1 Tax=Endocarpon pusillum TaxID=364733 RepID=A0A8H7AA11_9EURO|nr:hypothetical protein GJ744_001053 [Endocarpon pusillum]
MGELGAKIDVLIEKSGGKEVVRLDKMQLATAYQEVNEESLMGGSFPALPSMEESLGFFNVTAPEIRVALAQSIDILATDMYDDFDLSGINDGYLN